MKRQVLLIISMFVLSINCIIAQNLTEDVIISKLKENAEILNDCLVLKNLD